MGRLHHSYAGHLRSLQMSSTMLFVFVEGKQSDPYFYARICETTTALKYKYEICLAQQLPEGAGGKQRLIGFFDYLRKRRALTTSLGEKDTKCIFFFDKDVDDLRHKIRRSRHVVYTEHYDVQNYIFKHGNIVTGAASAASIDPARLHAKLNDSPAWCRHVATQWREWITFCLRVLEDGISCEANYGVHSRIQSRPSGPTDAMAHSNMIDDLARRRGVPVAEFRQQLAATTKKVDRYFFKEEYHRIFKGKWFAHVLADEIDVIMAGKPYHRNGLVDRLPSSVAATLDFTQAWADHFRNGIQRVIEC